jgi:dihydropyrimidinase
MDESGKFAHGRDAPFNRIANGMPGLETRLPLMFDAMVSRGLSDLETFMRLTSTAPADAFGLTGKGRIAVGADADIAIWDPEASLTYGADDLKDNTGYNPYEGVTVRGLPITVLSRGRTVMRDRNLTETPGHGQWLEMTPPA